MPGVSGETGGNSVANPQTTDLRSLSFGPHTGDLSLLAAELTDLEMSKPGMSYPADLVLLFHSNDSHTLSHIYTPRHIRKHTYAGVA